MTIQEAIEEIKKCRGNAEAKKIAVMCMGIVDDLAKRLGTTRQKDIALERSVLRLCIERYTFLDELDNFSTAFFSNEGRSIYDAFRFVKKLWEARDTLGEIVWKEYAEQYMPGMLRDDVLVYFNDIMDKVIVEPCEVASECGRMIGKLMEINRQDRITSIVDMFTLNTIADVIDADRCYSLNCELGDLKGFRDHG